MISLKNVPNAGQALQYFSKDNYYTQDRGLEHSEWFGKGALSLGLSGPIQREAFFDLLDGKVAGQELGKWVKNAQTGEKQREHQPGIDVTFSAPKSVSLMAEVYGSREVREAHESAVKEALRYIEKELAHTRQTQQGKTESVQTGNVAVALFRHNTSRDLDPQTHTHAVVMNVTRRKDGHWRSLTNEEIYNEQRVIGAIYTSTLADRLQTLGFELYRTDEKGNFEIAGITRGQIEHFSQRRTEIKADLKAKGVAIEDASAQQKQQATLNTRVYKKDVDQEVLLSAWKTRAQEIGIDVEALQVKATGQKEQGGVLRADKLTGRQAVAFAAAHLIEREAVVSKNHLMASAIEHGAGRVSAADVRRAFVQLEKSGDLVALPGGQYTTKKMLGSERWTLHQVHVQKAQTPKMMEFDEAAKRISDAEKRQGFQYTDGQREALCKVLSTEDRTVGIQGLAGTGKTTLLRSLREMAQQQGYQVRGLAPTGAATKVLASETGIASDTVSMFQMKERQLQKDIALAQRYASDFERKAEIWIVDESSFLSQRQKAQLDYLAEKAGAKVVYLGDTLQLQSVEAGKPFELAQKNGMETATMTEIRRQKTADLKEAVGIITGREFLESGQNLSHIALNNNARAFDYLDRSGRVYETPEKADSGKGKLVDAVVQDILKLDKVERANTLVITAFNADRKAINRGVREGLKASGELGQSGEKRDILVSKGWTRAIQKEAQYYAPGDVVRFGRDYQQIAASNGEYTRVAAVDASNGTVLLQKQDGSVIDWQPHKNTKVEVFETEQRELAFGECIRITRNSAELKNGEVGRIQSFSGDQAMLEVGHGKGKSLHAVDLSRHPHWDYAYASTVHAAQGATQRRVIFHIRTPEKGNEPQQGRALKSMAQVFGARSFYVGVTRASHEISIYTNNKALAAKAVSAKQDKSSAVEIVQRNDRERGLRGDLELNRHGSAEHDRGFER